MRAAVQAISLFALMLVVGRALQSIPALTSWQNVHLGAPFVSALAAHAGLSVLALLLFRPDAAGTGLNARQPARWLEIACMALAVVGTVGGGTFAALSALAWPPTGPIGAASLTAAYLLCLPLLALVLRRTRTIEAPPHPATPALIIGLLLLCLPVGWALMHLSVIAAQALYVVIVVGLGEELFYRGILAERLDHVRPGWGWALQAPLFGIAHVVLAPDPVSALGIGLWATAAGLCFGWLRMRSGTILAPAIVHGLTDVIGLVVVPAFLGA